MEEKVRYEDFRKRCHALLSTELTAAIKPNAVHPIVLAYVGDAVFSLAVRVMLTMREQDRVGVLHDVGARFVSARLQAKAYEALVPYLTEEEADIARRARNAKSTVPKSASVSEYRHSTALEALVGWLYLSGRQERLMTLMEAAMDTIRAEMLKDEGDS